MSRRSYRVNIQLDDNGWWFVDAPEVQGAHSEGQTLARARSNIREAIVLMEDLPSGAEEFDIEERIVLPVAVRRAVAKVQRARERAATAAEDAREATEEALDVLSSHLPELGLRDQAELVGVSFQRVQQLRPGTPRRGRRPAPTRQVG
jgi:predicted RNase H-like HicB family nuclease